MSQTVYLEGSKRGYDAYRLYLSIDLHFKGKVNGVTAKDGVYRPRLSGCKKSTYSSSPFMRLFERLGSSLSEKELAMLFVHYQIRPDRSKIYINNFNANDLESYKAHIRRLHYDVEKELRVIFKDLQSNGDDIFKGSPSRLTKMVFSGNLSLEAFIYLSSLTKIPESNDMVTSSVKDLVEKYRSWFLYFTDMSMDDHTKSANDLLQKIREDL